MKKGRTYLTIVVVVLAMLFVFQLYNVYATMPMPKRDNCRCDNNVTYWTAYYAGWRYGCAPNACLIECTVSPCQCILTLKNGNTMVFGGDLTCWLEPTYPTPSQR